MTRSVVGLLLSVSACPVSIAVIFLQIATNQFLVGFTDRFYKVRRPTPLPGSFFLRVVKDLRERYTLSDEDGTTCSVRPLWECDFGGEWWFSYLAGTFDTTCLQALSLMSISNRKRYGKFAERSTSIHASWPFN